MGCTLEQMNLQASYVSHFKGLPDDWDPWQNGKNEGKRGEMDIKWGEVVKKGRKTGTGVRAVAQDAGQGSGPKGF